MQDRLLSLAPEEARRILMSLAETYPEVEGYLVNLLSTEETTFFDRLKHVRQRYMKGAYYREAAPLIREADELEKEARAFPAEIRMQAMRAIAELAVLGQETIQDDGALYPIVEDALAAFAKAAHELGRIAEAAEFLNSVDTEFGYFDAPHHALALLGEI